MGLTAVAGVEPRDVPVALWRLHRARSVGAEVDLELGPGWTERRLVDVLHGSGFALVAIRRAGVSWRVTAVRQRTLADTVGPGMQLLCVGLNPSLYAADAGVAFGRPGNRFWPAMVQAGLVSAPGDPLAALIDHGVGLTDLVKRATVRAAELTVDEYAAGLGRLDRLATWLAPRSVCVIGLEGWRKVVDRRAGPGWQARGVGSRPAYVMPNPSGLNAHARPADLAAHLRAAAEGPAG